MALQHLRSSTANKRPLPAGMSAGQLAINTNLASPGLFFKDSNGDLVKVGPVHVGTTAPNVSPASGGQTGNTLGEQWLDTSGSTYVFKIWDGSQWRSEAGEFVNTSGDTMTGALVMDNQQQVRFRETTANGTNYIALQAPASVASDKTITLPDVTGTVVTTGDTGSVTSTMLLDGTIVNADVNASAAIAGTKISPDFGSQNVTTTGTATAAALIPSGSSVPTNGLYLPSSNNLALATNGTGRLFVTSTGQLLAGTSSTTADSTLILQGNASNSAGAGALQLNRGTTSTSITSSSQLGVLRFSSSDDKQGGGIAAIADGNWSGTSYPTAFTVSTVPTGSTTAIERVRITSDGKVGIGTSAPSQLLHLQSSGADAYVRTANGTVDYYSGINNASSSVDLNITTNHPLRFFTNALERARIDTSGRLLIGTSSSVTTQYSGQAQTQVHGSTSYPLSIGQFSNNAFESVISLLKSRGTLGNQGIVQNGDTINTIRYEASDGTGFITAASISAVINGTPGTNDMPGALLFSTTADGASSPTERMRIRSDGAALFGTATTPDGTQYGHMIYGGFLATSVATTASSVIHAFYNANGYVGGISVSGSATAYNTSSDYRLKENVVPLTGAIDRINQLQVRRFNFIADPDKTVDGFIAHEAQAVVPECVTGEKDEVDADGKPVYQGIDQSKLVPLLTAALQEALAEIESLKARVGALEP